MRIRTIKPEFFTHEGLYDAEKEFKLPIRVAFAGLWCAADRCGRFKWEPRRLGVSILPYDNIDFSRVLDACRTRGFIVKYRVNNEWYGAIPSWKKHQFINNRESESTIPDITQSEQLDAPVTRDPREGDAYGKEGKVKEGEGNGKGKPVKDGGDQHALEIYQAYPRKEARVDALKAINKAITAAGFERVLERTKAYAQCPRVRQCLEDGTQNYIPHPATWFNRAGYDDDPAFWEADKPRNGSGPALDKSKTCALTHEVPCITIE